MFTRRNKAESLMVSYVLLIVIGIAISVFVFAYLKLYLPENRKSCELDTEIAIVNASCIYNDQDLSITLENRGLFNISGVFIRFGVPGEKVKVQLNEDKEFLGLSGGPGPLSPGEKKAFNYDSAALNLLGIDLERYSTYELEVQSAILDKGFLIPCEDVVNYQVTCE